MPYTLVSEYWWKNSVLEEVKKENEVAHHVLLSMTEDYDKFGINGTRAIRVATFVPSYKLRHSFRFDSTRILEEEWKRIDSALEEKGIYGNK